MKIGEKIRQLRTAKGLTQRELAARAGYTDHTTIARVETGKGDLPQSKIVKIAAVLGVPAGYLVDDRAQPEDLGAVAAEVLKDPALLQLVQDYLAMDGSDRATVCALVGSLAKKKKD